MDTETRHLKVSSSIPVNGSTLNYKKGGRPMAMTDLYQWTHLSALPSMLSNSRRAGISVAGFTFELANIQSQGSFLPSISYDSGKVISELDTRRFDIFFKSSNMINDLAFLTLSSQL